MKAAPHDPSNRRIRTIFRRHECKYLVPEELAVAVRAYARPYVEPDPFAVASPDRSYGITSLYLDSPDLRLFRETEEGLLHRIKLRIRSYDEAGDAPAFLEIKRRYNSLVLKDRARLEKAAVATILDGGVPDASTLRGAQRRCYEEYVGWMARWLARPMVWVRYRREAHVGIFNPDVRITMDRELSCTPAGGGIAPPRASAWLPVETRMVVLEVKFDASCPDWITRLIQHFGLVRRSYSKYGNSVRRGLPLLSPLAAQCGAVGA